MPSCADEDLLSLRSDGVVIVVEGRADVTQAIGNGVSTSVVTEIQVDNSLEIKKLNVFVTIYFI